MIFIRSLDKDWLKTIIIKYCEIKDKIELEKIKTLKNYY